jgi:hypothetical protein
MHIYMIDQFSKSFRNEKEICLYDRLFIDFKQKKWYCEKKKDILFICMNTIRKRKRMKKGREEKRENNHWIFIQENE